MESVTTAGRILTNQPWECNEETRLRLKTCAPSGDGARSGLLTCGSIRLCSESRTGTCEKIDFTNFAIMIFQWVTL